MATLPSTNHSNQTSSWSARGILIAQMGTALTFSAEARRGGTVLAEKVDNFSGSGARAHFTSNAAWTAAPTETSQTVRRVGLYDFTDSPE